MGVGVAGERGVGGKGGEACTLLAEQGALARWRGGRVDEGFVGAGAIPHRTWRGRRGRMGGRARLVCQVGGALMNVGGMQRH